MSEYPHPPRPFFGETSAPPPVPIPQFAPSPGSSPRPWPNYNPNYTPFPNTILNNLGSAGPQPLLQGNGYEVNAPPYCQGLSDILKKLLSHRIAHPESEVVAFHKESSGHGKTRVTVTFETIGEM